jgi:hypothetical protein
MEGGTGDGVFSDAFLLFSKELAGLDPGMTLGVRGFAVGFGIVWKGKKMEKGLHNLSDYLDKVKLSKIKSSSIRGCRLGTWSWGHSQILAWHIEHWHRSPAR